MFKLFYKTLLNSFLWIILLANIFLVFQIASPLNFVGEQMKPNSYFGVSSLIEMFQYLPNTPLGQVTDRLQLVYNKLFNLSAKYLNEQWLNSAESFQRAFDNSGNQETSLKILSFLTGIFYMLSSFLTSGFSVLIGMAAVVIFIVYIIFFAINLLTFILYAVQGMFSNLVPSHPSMDITPYIQSLTWLIPLSA